MKNKAEAMNKILAFARKAQGVVKELSARGYKVKANGRLYTKDHDWLIQRLGDGELYNVSYNLTFFYEGEYLGIELIATVRQEDTPVTWSYISKSFEFVLKPFDDLVAGEPINFSLPAEPITIEQLQAAEDRTKELEEVISKAKNELNTLKMTFLWS